MEAEPEPVDLACALHWVGGDRALLQELVGIFVEEAPGRLADLKRATVARDAKTVERVAHSLKGSAGILGAASLRAASAELEERVLAQRVDGEMDLVARVEGELERVLAFFRDPAWRGRLDLDEAP